ncbi:MAG: glucuronate isomerase [Bacteroidota bacterium]
MYNRLHKPLIDEDFLLRTDFSKKLYHSYAKHLPIIDYHNHLPPYQIVNDSAFNSITEVWLKSDHYKWRAMRTLGIDEKYITGGASDSDKFLAWARTVPYTLRNPLFHWTHLELQRYFQIDGLLDESSASRIYAETQKQLRQKSHSTLGLMAQMKVEVVATTDDPTDDLEHHRLFSKHDGGLKMIPSFRPDKAYFTIEVEKYGTYLEQLGACGRTEIKTYGDLIEALKKRADFFKEMGCKSADHGLECLNYFELGHYDCERLFKRLIHGKSLTLEEQEYFQFETLVHLARHYHALGWIQQFHLGALRNTNQRMLVQLGPDTGFDSIGDFRQARSLAQFLNLLDRTDQLTKTIIYNLNPADNEVFASMIGNFNDGSVKGKMQFGSAWWFLDQKDGMEKQLNSLSSLGLLSCFIGMLTDSRSFLSFPRHEYFRRILCNLIGTDVANGELPPDEKWLGKIVSDICYHNVKEYFGF